MSHPCNLIRGANPGSVPEPIFYVTVAASLHGPTGVAGLLDVTWQILLAWKMKGRSGHVSRDDSFLCDEPQSHSLLNKPVIVIKDNTTSLQQNMASLPMTSHAISTHTCWHLIKHSHKWWLEIVSEDSLPKRVIGCCLSLSKRMEKTWMHNVLL